MSNTGIYSSWYNVKDKLHHISIYNMVRLTLIEINKSEKLCCAAETAAEVFGLKLNISINNVSHYFSWYGLKPSILELHSFGCSIYPIIIQPNRLDKYHR